MNGPTPEPLSEAKQRLLQRYLSGQPAAVATESGIPKRAPGNVVPQSFNQEQVWIHTQIQADQPGYNELVTLHRHGPVDVVILERCLGEIVRRHEIWRTTFDQRDGMPVQIVHDTFPPVPLDVVDLRALPETLRRQTSLNLAAEAARIPFDLTRLPLFHGRLVRLADEEYQLHLTLHHLIMDGVTVFRNFLSELIALYDAFTRGQPSPLPEPALQYADFAVWQRQALNDQSLASDLAYWRRQLSGDLPILSWPNQRPRPAKQTFRGATETLHLPGTVIEPLKSLAERESATLFMALTAGLVALLHRYTGQQDIILGTPSANRTAETEGMFGYFINMLPLRFDLSGSPSYRELLRRTRRVVAEALSHGKIPLLRLLKEVKIPMDLSRNPLFQIVMTLEPVTAPHLSGWDLTQAEVSSGSAKLDLEFRLELRNDGITAPIVYNPDLIEPAMVVQAFRHWETLLRAAVADPDRPIARLPLLTHEERLATGGFAGQSHRSPPAECIPELFRRQAVARPHAEALLCGGHRWTYQDLDRLSDVLAAELQARGITVGGRVGLHLERSPEWVVAALAILKAGAAYVPLLPSWPKPRLGELASGAGVDGVLTASSDPLDWLPPQTWCLSGALRPLPQDPGPSRTVDPGLTPETPAYILFTSGSTGRPKGVLVPHRAVCRLVTGQDYAPFGPGLRCLHLSSPAFDASTFEVWAPLLSGGACVIHPEARLDIDLLERDIHDSRVNCLWLTAGLFNQLIDLRATALTGVTDLLTGGEVISEPHVRKALEALPATRLIHCYGPTETTTFATAGRIPPISEWIPDQPISIGRELVGTRGEILDENGEPVPPGEPGELYIGGDGVALGYVNDEELTAARFVRDPADPSGRLRRYRTGDRVRRLPDGNLVFVGRLDAQIKIRGHRIEPGEIEAVLMSHPSVQQAIVFPQRNAGGTQELIACLQRRPGTTLNAVDLRGHLAARLPEYLMPARFREVDSVPLTPTGKVDRNALAELGGAELVSEATSVAPRTRDEAAIAAVWTEVLGRDSVGVHDNFFEMGGDSLLALRLAARLQTLLNRPVRLADLFARPTVAQFAGTLPGARNTDQGTPTLFRGQRTGTPWIHVPGTFGLEFLTPSLADLIGRHRPVFDGLQYPGLADDSEPLCDVESIATSLVPQVEAVHPQGPLWLSGYSFGGMVAYELARQLTARGRAVECVVLFDTVLPGGLRRRPVPEHARVTLQRIRALPLKRRLEFLLGLAEKKWSDAAAAVRRRRPGGERDPRKRVENASLVAFDAFQPQPYAGRVILLRSLLLTEQETGIWAKRELNGWDDVQHDRFEVLNLPCDHGQVFLDPVAPEVLTAIETLLQVAIPSATPGS